MKKILGIVLGCLLFSGVAWAHDGEYQGVHFVKPQDGAVVSSDVDVVMAVRGMGIHKAGDLVQGTGHFHIIVDGGFVPAGEIVAKDITHIHFGKGQVEATLKLPKGKHRLTLQLADGHHVSYGKAWSQTIQITVQ